MPQQLEAPKPLLQLQPRHLQILLQLLKQHVPQAEVWAYGSRVTGTGHDGSDLDLVLRHPLDLTRDVDGWAELQTALQDSPLPMLVDTHQWSRLPASFRTSIEEAHVMVQVGA